jgi:predicted RNase H-like HicB family nuclease
MTLVFLRKSYPGKESHLAELRFLTDGETIFVMDRDPQKIFDTLKRGQFVFSLALGEIIEGLQGELKKFAAPKEERVMVDGHTYTVVLIPDLEDGGFTVQCVEEPAAISQGETEQEAIDNIIEALEEHFEYVKEQEAGKAQAV